MSDKLVQVVNANGKATIQLHGKTADVIAGGNQTNGNLLLKDGEGNQRISLSGIDSEVMSQIGTKITCLLDNERDIDSVLAGVSGKSELKSVLARLESRQQALIFGHAVPMPVVVRARPYGSPKSYQDFIPGAETETGKQAEKDIEELW